MRKSPRQENYSHSSRFPHIENFGCAASTSLTHLEIHDPLPRGQLSSLWNTIGDDAASANVSVPEEAAGEAAERISEPHGYAPQQPREPQKTVLA
jgi:hypothetical protein